MIKDIKIENIDAAVDLKNKLWQALNLLRGSMNVNDYHFILYLLTLQRNGLLKDLAFSDQADLKQQIEFCIKNHEGTDAPKFQSLYYEYEHILKEVDNKIIYEIIRLFKSLNQTVLQEHFAEIFDDLLYKLLQSQGRLAGEFTLPPELSRFVCSLVEVPSQSIKKLEAFNMVYNPFAGLASFGVLLPKDILYVGQEMNKTIWALGVLRLMAYNMKDSFLAHENSLENWRNSIHRRPVPHNVENKEDYKFDTIISNPPIGVRLPNPLNGKFGNINNYEHFLIEKGIEDLRHDGKLIAVLSQGFLFRSGSEHGLRQYLIENDLLEMVISIPGGLLMNTGIPLVIIVLNKDKKEKGIVSFIDGTKFVESFSARKKKLNDYTLYEVVKGNIKSDSLKIVSNETIKEYDYNFNVLRYFQVFVDGEPLSELVSIIRGQRFSEGQFGKFIRIRDLKEDKLDYEINIIGVEQIQLPRPSQKISESCLLLATRWRTLKPTFFNYTGESIFITPDIIALKVDENKIDISYLINELNTQYVLEQVDAFRTGTSIPAIGKEDLLKIKIQVVNINEQRAKVKGVKEALLDEKKKELALLNKLHGFEEDIYNQNSFLRHLIAGPLKNLRSSFKNLKSIIENQIVQSIPDLMLLKERANSELDFGKYLEIMERDLKIVSENTRRNGLDDDSIQDYILEPIELFAFLENYICEVKNRENLVFEIDLKYDKALFLDAEGKRSPVFINGNANLLRDLFNNLVENAEKHAFELTKKIGNKIEIDVMAADSDIHMLFSNNGNLFPENFSHEMFIRKGSKTGINGGNGFGGWYINEIMKKHKGYFELLDPENELITESYPISFYFEFPLTTE